MTSSAKASGNNNEAKAIIAAPPTTQVTFRCMNCKARFRRTMQISLSAKAYVAEMRNLRCPDCGAGWKKIGLGEGRTLAEDIGDRIEGSEAERAAHWLTHGERGSSANAIHITLSGMGLLPAGDAEHPRDLDDMRRCILLLGHMPEWRGRLSEMARASATWARLVASWDAIEAALLQEAPNLDKHSPTAAALFREAVADRTTNET
jgi:DNA-directed RNA polymerase subunit RPC12/RpoP